MEEEKQCWADLTASMSETLQKAIEQYNTSADELKGELARIKKEKELKAEKFNSMLTQTKRVFEKQQALIKEREMLTFEQIENWENRYDTLKDDNSKLIDTLKKEIAVLRGSI